MCWLRDGAGLGSVIDEERGVFRVDVSRTTFLNDADDPWRDGLAHLISALPLVFPSCTFEGN